MASFGRGVVMQVVQRSGAQSTFTYKVRIINPSRKSDVVVRQMHHFKSKFDSVITLHAKLIEEFKDQVPNSVTFNVGYYEGQRHAKMAIVTEEDLAAMYQKYSSGDISLWCDGRLEENNVTAKKRKRDEVTATRYEDKENEIDEVYKELKSKHLDKYDNPKLRLWARMIGSHLHESTDEPPNIPAFGSAKKPKRESISEVLSEAAVAVRDTLAKNASSRPVHTVPAALSTDLRLKNYEQLRIAKQLNIEGILTDAEFEKQKQNILRAIEEL